MRCGAVPAGPSTLPYLFVCWCVIDTSNPCTCRLRKRAGGIALQRPYLRNLDSNCSTTSCLVSTHKACCEELLLIRSLTCPLISLGCLGRNLEPHDALRISPSSTSSSVTVLKIRKLDAVVPELLDAGATDVVSAG